MPEGSFTIIPDPDPAPAQALRGFTIVPDPDPAPTPAASAPTFTIIPDPDPAPALSLGATVAPVDRDLEGQRAVAMATMPGPMPLPEVLAPQGFTDPMSGMPMAALPSLAQTVTPTGDRDLEGQRAAAMADPVSLGERFALNAGDAYYGGTLAGSVLLAELQRAAQMSPQEWAEWNTAVRYAGGALKPLPSPAEAQAEIARIAADRKRYETIPWSGSLGEAVVAVGGQLAGGLVTPESGINRVPGVAQGVGAISRAAPVIGRTVERAIGETGQAVAGRMLESGLSQGVVNTAVDPLAQVGSIQTGMQPGYDPLRTAIAFPAGVAIGAGMHGATEAAGAGVRALLPTPPVPATSPIDAAAVERLQPTGQVSRTERTEIVPEQPVATAAPPPPAGEPYAQTIAPAAPARIEPAPVVEPTARAEPPPSPAPIAEPPPERLPSAAAEPLRQEPPIAAPAEGSALPVGRSEAGREALLPPENPYSLLAGQPNPVGKLNRGNAQAAIPEAQRREHNAQKADEQFAAEDILTEAGIKPGDQVTAPTVYRFDGFPHPGRPAPETGTLISVEGRMAQIRGQDGTTWTAHVEDVRLPDDRSGAATGRPGEPAPVGETGPARVEPVAGEVPGGARLGTDLGERPGDTQAARAGEPVEPAALPTEPPARAAEAPVAEQAAPVTLEPAAAQIRPAETPATEPAAPVAGLTAEQTAIMRRNIADAEGSREGGVRVVADQLQYMPEAGREPGTPSEREAAHVIDRAVAAEIARGGDPQAFRNEAAQRGAGPVRLEDQATVPGQEARATNPQLEKLRATRDELQAKPNRTPADNQKLRAFDGQIQKAETAQERRGGVKQPFSGPPKVGREKDFLDYKFNDGTSVYRSVFAEAGHNPDTATSLPIERQTEILSRHMEKKFGFSKVEVVGVRGEPASRVDHKTSRDAMLDMTRATHDLMAILGLPPEAASLNGKLRLVIEPTGKPGPFGQYESSGVIYVRGGANSLGHEWMHAIDHLLAERFTNNPRDMNKFLTQYGRDSGLNVTDNVQAAMAKLINTMFYEDAALAARHLALSVDAAKVDKAGNPTKKALEAQDQLERLEAGGSKLRIHSSDYRQQAAALPNGVQYYSRVYEMLARAGEAYMSDKARASGVDPRGFVMPDEAYNNMVDRQLRMAYPKQDERNAIFAAYDDLFKAMQAESILDQGKSPATAANYSITDPHYWSITAPAAAGAGMSGLPGLIKREINSYNNFTGRLRDALRLTDPNRPPPLPGQAWADRTKDFGRAALYSYGSMMKVIIARAPPEAQKILQPILDSLATAPGSGRYTPENFEEKVRDTGRGWTRQFGNMLENAGFKLSLSTIVQSRVGSNEAMTTEQGLMLRHGLVTGDSRMPDGTPIPANIQELTGHVRQLLDRVWKTADDASLDIGYAQNGFYPRIYDRYRAAADPSGFQREAHKLYSFMFDSEVKAPGTDPQALLEKWTTMPAESRALKTNALNADPDLPTKMAELRRNLQEQQDPNIIPAELARLQGEAQQLAIDAHDSLRGHIAELNAADWHANLTGGAMSDFDTGSPGGKFLQARVLPPEADQIMAGYMHTDPMVAIPGYLHSVARRTAHAELFGANNEVIDQAIAKLNRIDGMSGDDTTKFMELVADVTGRNQRGAWVRFGQSAHNVVQGLGTLAMMERAVWSSLTEPLAGGLTTGDMRVAWKNMGYTFGQLMHTASARDRTALAEFLNVISSPQHDSVMLSRQGVDVNDQPQMGRLLSNFYRATFLTQVTNGQRTATVAASNWFVDKLAQHILDTGTDKGATHGRQDAARWLNELGLPAEHHKAFSQFMADLQGKLPTPDMLKNHRFGDAYSLVIRRLTDRIIQDPYKVDRAMLSGRPILGLAYQLMSFNYSLQKNVLNPAGERLVHNFTRGRSEAMAAGGQIKGALAGLASHPGAIASTVGAAFAMFAGSLMHTIVRQYILAPDQWDKHQKEGDLGEYLKDLAFSRSGLNGVFDPILQAFSHLKYDSDLMAVTHGASPNYYVSAINKILQPLLGPSDPKTNTQLYNAAQGMFNLIGVPLTAYGLTAVSSIAGPIGKIGAGVALQTLTSPAASNRIATILTGPKGAKRAEPAGAEGFGELPGMGGMDGLPGMDDGTDPGKGAEAAGGLGAAAGPILGIMDDVMIPAMRYLGPMISSLSPATKIAAGIGAGAYGTYEFLKAGAPFRGQPAPPPKNARQ